MTARLGIDALCVSLGRRAVVSDVSAAFQAGELVALAGPNGAGKTSLLRAILGALPATGAITIDGEAAARLPPAGRARAIAYLPQGHISHWPIPVRDIVALGRYPHGARDPDRLSAHDAAAVARALDLTGAAPLSERLITELSGGERARVALARVLAVEAPIVLADEPTAALDPGYQIDIMACLAGVAAKGALVIAVTHDLALAGRFASRVLVLNKGRLAADAPPPEAFKTSVLREVFGIEAIQVTEGGHTAAVPWRRSAP